MVYGGPMARTLTVLESFIEPLPTTNPYNMMLLEALDGTPGLKVKCFSWRTALVGRYDVFHVHWPEVRLMGSTPSRATVHQALWVALLARLAVTRTPLVRTLHNLELPSGLNRAEIAMLRAAERLTALWITINDTTKLPVGTAQETILHGHYRDWYGHYPTPDMRRGRIAFFGGVRRYKGVENLVRAFRQTTDAALSLSIFGNPTSTELENEVTQLAAGDARIELRLRFASEAELVDHIGQAELVVLPYREMHNSGGALAALSLDRPILVPENETTLSLAAEVGPGWVYTFSSELNGEVIERSLTQVREDRARQTGRSRPDLSRRHWNEAGRAHLRAFERAVDRS